MMNDTALDLKDVAKSVRDEIKVLSSKNIIPEGTKVSVRTDKADNLLKLSVTKYPKQLYSDMFISFRKGKAGLWRDADQEKYHKEALETLNTLHGICSCYQVKSSLVFDPSLVANKLYRETVTG